KRTLAVSPVFARAAPTCSTPRPSRPYCLSAPARLPPLSERGCPHETPALDRHADARRPGGRTPLRPRPERGLQRRGRAGRAPAPALDGPHGDPKGQAARREEGREVSVFGLVVVGVGRRG